MQPKVRTGKRFSSKRAFLESNCTDFHKLYLEVSDIILINVKLIKMETTIENCFDLITKRHQGHYVSISHGQMDNKSNLTIEKRLFSFVAVLAGVIRSLQSGSFLADRLVTEIEACLGCQMC